MIDTAKIQNRVAERVEAYAKGDINPQTLISQLKGTLISVAAKRGITIDESVDVAAKLIILASII